MRDATKIQYWALWSLLALLLVGLAWEIWLAPLRSGGSWWALKVLPLCLPLTGLLKARLYTFQYTSMLVLPYFAEAVMRLFDAAPMSRLCAAVSLVCAVSLFVACLIYVHRIKQERIHG